MEFIKRHYEKLILLALSIISAFAVWRMSEVMEETKNVKDSDLKIDIPAADQVSLKQKKAELERKSSELATARAEANKVKSDENVEKVKTLEGEVRKLKDDQTFADYLRTGQFEPRTLIAQTGLSWERSTPHAADRQNYHSDLVDIFKMAECPYCHYGVPYYCFTTSHKCLICGGELKSPPAKIKKRRRPTPDDLDGDGFSNLYEINVSNTDPRNPTSCPPLWRRLRFKKMAKIKLPIQISGIDVGNNPDPKTWEASIKLEFRDPRTGKMRRREQDCKIGDTLNFDGRKYMLTSIERLFEKDDNGIERKKDIVTLRMVAADDREKSEVHELKLVFGQPVYSSDLRVVLEDIGVPAEADGMRYYTIRGGKQEAVYELRRGEVFEMGGVSDRGSARTVPKMTYVMTDFDEKGKVAQLALARNRSNVGGEAELERDEQGVPMEVTWEGFIVEDEWVTMPTDRPEDEKPRGGNAPRPRI